MMNTDNRRYEYDELMFDGMIAKCHRVGVKMPDGKVVPRDLIRYPGASLALPVLDDGGIVLIRNRRFAVDEDLWELPCGVLEAGEDPGACAARELTEETGYSAGRVDRLGQFYTGPGTTDEVMHCYLATELTDGRQELERYEQIVVEVTPDAKVREMVTGGTIHDGKTIAALGMYWLSKGTI